MLNKNVSQRLESLETKVDKHLIDGVTVLTNIATLQVNMDVVKKYMWVCIGTSLSTLGALLVALVSFLLKK